MNDETTGPSRPYAEPLKLSEPPRPPRDARLEQLYIAPAYVSAVVADSGNAGSEDDGVTIYCVAEGAPILLYFPRKVAHALIAQVALKL